MWVSQFKILNAELGGLIGNSNISVIGLGHVASTNLELNPINALETLIPISLNEGSSIIPFDTVKIEDYENHSIMYVDAIDLVTHEIFPLSFKASVVKEGHQTHLHDDEITGDVFLKFYHFDIEAEN